MMLYASHSIHERDKLKNAYDEIKVPKLKIAEIELLAKYVKVTEPLAKALDILKVDYCFLDTEMPVLIGLKKN